MKSYKCEYCNLTNWTEAVVCKRCQMPNPFLPEHEGLNDLNEMPEPEQQFASETQSAERANYQNQPQQNTLYQPVDPNLPPPPNIYGQRAGTTLNNANPNFPLANQNYVSPEEEMLWTKSLKQIKSAGRAGLVWSILLVIGSAVMLFAMAMISSAPKTPELNTPQIEALPVMAAIIVGLTVVISLLSYGIYKRKMFCAVLITILVGVGLLNNLASIGDGAQGIGSLIFSILFIYYFANGIQGISNYNKLKSKYPDLQE